MALLSSSSSATTEQAAAAAQKKGAGTSGRAVALGALVLGMAGLLQFFEDHLSLSEEHYVMLAFVAVAYVALEKQGKLLAVKKKLPKKVVDDDPGEDSEADSPQKRTSWKSRAEMAGDWRRDDAMAEEEQQEDGLQTPAVRGYKARLRDAVRGRDMPKAVEIFEEMDQAGGLVAPDLFCYNTLVHGFAAQGDLEKAEDWFARATETAGFAPDVYSFAPLIRACYRKEGCYWGPPKDMAKGEAWLSKMREAGIVGDTMLSNLALESAAKAGQMPKVDMMLFQMLDEGPAPDTQSFNIAMKAWQKENNTTRVEAWFKRMQARKVAPDYNTYLAMILAYGQAGNVKKAEEVLRKMGGDGAAASHGVAPHPQCYNAMLQAYALKASSGKAPEDFEKLWSFLEFMRNKGLEPTVATYQSLVKPFASSGDMAGVEKVLGMMRKDGMNPLTEPSMLQAILATHLGKAREARESPTGAVHLIEEAITAGAVLDMATLVMLERVAGAKQVTLLLERHKQISGHGWKPKGDKANHLFVREHLKSDPSDPKSIKFTMKRQLNPVRSPPPISAASGAAAP